MEAGREKESPQLENRQSEARKDIIEASQDFSLDLSNETDEQKEMLLDCHRVSNDRISCKVS